jgi:hypothetical protein
VPNKQQENTFWFDCRYIIKFELFKILQIIDKAKLGSWAGHNHNLKSAKRPLSF